LRGLFSGSSEEDSLLATTAPSVISLHCTQNEVVQRAFASLLFYRMYQEMFHRGLQQRITHAIVFDEAHRASRLKLLGSMGKEGRKYGLSLILASQEARDFSPSMYSAVANYLVLRVTDQDAKALAKNVAPSNSARQIADELKQLPKHEAIFFQEGSKPSRTRLAADARRPANAGPTSTR
jgi:DNA helicase HerA-like ATPase